MNPTVILFFDLDNQYSHLIEYPLYIDDELHALQYIKRCSSILNYYAML